MFYLGNMGSVRAPATSRTELRSPFLFCIFACFYSLVPWRSFWKHINRKSRAIKQTENCHTLNFFPDTNLNTWHHTILTNRYKIIREISGKKGLRSSIFELHEPQGRPFGETRPTRFIGDGWPQLAWKEVCLYIPGSSSYLYFACSCMHGNSLRRPVIWIIRTLSYIPISRSR